MVLSPERDPGWSGVVPEGSVAEVAPQGSGRPRPCPRIQKDVLGPQHYLKQILGRREEEWWPKRGIFLPLLPALRRREGGRALRSGRRAQPPLRVGPG